MNSLFCFLFERTLTKALDSSLHMLRWWLQVRNIRLSLGLRPSQHASKACDETCLTRRASNLLQANVLKKACKPNMQSFVTDVAPYLKSLLSEVLQHLVSTIPDRQQILCINGGTLLGSYTIHTSETCPAVQSNEFVPDLCVTITLLDTPCMMVTLLGYGTLDSSQYTNHCLLLCFWLWRGRRVGTTEAVLGLQ